MARSEALGSGEMARRIREFDWAATPLGPIASWSPRLLASLQTMLASRFQFAIYWGPELVFLYNDAEIPTLGDRHPEALGMRAAELLSTTWDVVGPQLESVLGGGDATWAEDQPLLFRRNGKVEQVYFTYSYSPMRDEAGRVVGVLLSTEETTRRVIGEQQLRTLQLLASEAALARSEAAVCLRAAEAIGANPGVVFTQVYLFDGGRLSLAASCGPPVGGAGEGSPPSEWRLLDVMRGSRPGIVAVAGDRAPGFAVAAPIAERGTPRRGRRPDRRHPGREADRRRPARLRRLPRRPGSPRPLRRDARSRSRPAPPSASESSATSTTARSSGSWRSRSSSGSYAIV